MRSLLKISMMALLVMFIFSCSKNDNNTTTLTGSWKVSSLVVNGNDLTAECEPYTITFNENGMMSVHDSANTYTCGWSENSGMMHDGMMDYHFDMGGCADDSPMQELDHDWVTDTQTEQSCSFHEKDAISNILSIEKI